MSFKYAEPNPRPLTARMLAEGGHECDRCGSVIARSPAAFKYHAKKCEKRERGSDGKARDQGR